MPNRYHRLLLALAALVLAAGAARAADPVQRPERARKGPTEVVIGGLFNLAGPLESLDRPMLEGSRLAVDEINARGGILGRQVRLAVEDGKGRPEMLARGVEKIVRQNPSTSAFVGLSDTDMVLAASTAAAEQGRLFLTPGATSPQLPGQVPQYLYLACFGDNVQAAAAAEFAYQELGARSVAVLYDSTDTYTNLLQGYFRTRFAELGGEIVSAEAYVPGKLDEPIAKLKQADFIFLSAHTPDDAIEGVGLLRAAGFDVPIVGGDGFDSESDWAGKTAVENVFFTTHAYLGSDATDPSVQAFARAFAAANNGEHPSGFAALGYDAVKIAAEAIRRAGSTEPSAVLAAMGGIQDFEGVTGRINYGDGTRIPTKSVSVIEVAGGRYRLAAEQTPSSVPAP